LFVLICLIVAAVLFALAAFGVVASRINLVAAGLFFWVLTAIIPKL
jgi:NADH:ubiquinone oxidoreductase subunit K